jgi:hypothetical protein
VEIRANDGDDCLRHHLLRTRERLAAAIDGAGDWARADAMPSLKEITRIRRLISRIKGDITGLTGSEQRTISRARLPRDTGVGVSPPYTGGPELGGQIVVGGPLVSR